MKKRKRIKARAYSPGQAWFVGTLLVVATFALFARTASFGFINFDDPAYTFEQPQVVSGISFANIGWAFTHVHSGNWHPLTSISHMLDCQVFGLSPGAFHLENVIWHSLATLLLFYFLLRASSALWLSGFAAAFFAIHPLRIESVSWIAERKDVLSAVWFMLTLIFYLRYTEQRTRGRCFLVAGFFALGLMTKPMVVTTPVILLLLDYWPLSRWQRMSFRELLSEKWLLFILAALSVGATLVAQKEALSNLAQLPLSLRLANALAGCWIYFRQFFWPTNLAFFYPYPDQINPVQTSLALLGLATATFLCWRARREYPWLVVGWLWYLAMLAPVIGVIHAGKQGHADRYTYLPEIGLGILVTWSAAAIPLSYRVRRFLFPVAAAIVLLSLLVATWRQLWWWRDPILLWQRTIAVTQDNFIAHSYLADLLLRENRVKESLAEAQTAVRLGPDDSGALNNEAIAYFRSGKPAEAAASWERSLAQKPDEVNAQSGYAWLLATCPERSLRNGQRAVELTQNLLRHGGDQNPMVLRAAGAALAESGRFEEAIAMAQKGLGLAEGQGNGALVQDLNLNIANYRARLPLRDPGLNPAP